jgi:hypothetical protein
VKSRRVTAGGDFLSSFLPKGQRLLAFDKERDHGCRKQIHFAVEENSARPLCRGFLGRLAFGANF